MDRSADSERVAVHERVIAVLWLLWFFNASGGWIGADTDALALAIPLFKDYELAATIWQPTPAVLVTIWLQSTTESRRLAVVELSPVLLLLLVAALLLLVQHWSRPSEDND
ncbi:MAG: hypothetical protein NVS2B7_38240 [Herpetosiphon sp.]